MYIDTCGERERESSAARLVKVGGCSKSHLSKNDMLCCLISAVLQRWKPPDSPQCSLYRPLKKNNCPDIKHSKELCLKRTCISCLLFHVSMVFFGIHFFNQLLLLGKRKTELYVSYIVRIMLNCFCVFNSNLLFIQYIVRLSAYFCCKVADLQRISFSIFYFSNSEFILFLLFK